MPLVDHWLADIIAGWQCHAHAARSPQKSVRSFDGATPYGVHPTAAACLLAQESLLPWAVRNEGFTALVLHDVLEDTKDGLPPGTSDTVISLVQEMSFQGGSKQEFNELPNRSPLVQLLKLYDKLSNLMDGVGQNGWMASRGQSYLNNYLTQTLLLAERVHGFMPQLAPAAPPGAVLNAVLFVRALAKQYIGAA